MVGNMAIRFLGTSSQTGVSRNYSSLLVKFDHHIVMVDCGESTQRQLQNRFIGGSEKPSNIRHIFITHLHADHVLGLVPLLCTLMGPSTGATEAEGKKPRVEIFGPSGLRALVRTTLTLCYTTLSGTYTVHELLWPKQTALPSSSLNTRGATSENVVEGTTPLLGAVNGPQRVIPNLPQHENELPGKDLRLDEESVSWQAITNVAGVNISAAPILHRCPAVGYVFEEPATASQSLNPVLLDALERNASALQTEQGIRNPKSLLGKLLKDREILRLPDGTEFNPPALDTPGRKLVILGDTYDATAALGETPLRGIPALAQDADVLVHESTNAALPGRLLGGKNRGDERLEDVHAKALSRGHSTAQSAGQFAARCGARQLLLNHFSVRYPAASNRVEVSLAEDGHGDEDLPRSEGERQWHVMRTIERQATEAWHAGLEHRETIFKASAQKRSAIASYDGFVYPVPLRADPDTPVSAETADQHHAQRTGGRLPSSYVHGMDTHSRDMITHTARHLSRGRGRSRGRSRGRAYGQGSTIPAASDR